MAHQAHPPAAAVEPPEDLRIDGHELAGCAHIEAPKTPRGLGEEMAEAVRAVATQDPVHGARVQTEVRSEQVRSPAQLQTQTEDAGLDGIGGTPGRAVRP